MRIIKSFPPNFTAIAKAFPVVKGRPGILYAWGDIIYNPSGVVVPPWLVAHEEVHGERQTDGRTNPEDWWDWYLQDDEYRLKEEILAHQQEWVKYSGPYRDRYLGSMAERLSGPLYGNMLSYNEAVKEITNGKA